MMKPEREMIYQWYVSVITANEPQNYSKMVATMYVGMRDYLMSLNNTKYTKNINKLEELGKFDRSVPKEMLSQYKAAQKVIRESNDVKQLMARVEKLTKAKDSSILLLDSRLEEIRALKLDKAILQGKVENLKMVVKK